MTELKNRVNEEIAAMESAVQSLGYLHIDEAKSVQLISLIKDQQSSIEELESANKDLENMLEARDYKFGDNTCACSCDRIDDICMAHVPKVRELEAKLAKLPNAIMLADLEPKDIDCTDYADAAWWRGQEYAANSICYRINELIDNQEEYAGVASEPWETTRKKIFELVAIKAKLDSPELVEKVACAIRVTPDIFLPVHHSLCQEYESLDGSTKMAKAAIDTIKGNI